MSQRRDVAFITPLILFAVALVGGCGSSRDSTAATAPAEAPPPIAASVDEVEQRYIDAAGGSWPKSWTTSPTVETIDTPDGATDVAIWEAYRPQTFLMGELSGDAVTTIGVRYAVEEDDADVIASRLLYMIDPDLADDEFTTRYLEFVSSNADNPGASTFFTGIGGDSRTLYVVIDKPSDIYNDKDVIAFSGPFTTEAEAAAYVDGVVDTLLDQYESHLDCCATPDDATGDGSASS